MADTGEGFDGAAMAGSTLLERKPKLERIKQAVLYTEELIHLCPDHIDKLVAIACTLAECGRQEANDGN